MAHNPELVEFIDRLIETEYDTASNLASEINMSLSAFSRAVREEGTLSEGNCMKLANLCGERLSKVLRIAHRPKEVIEAADNLYGNDETLSRREKRLVKLWRNAEPNAQDAILALLQVTAASAPSSGQPMVETPKKKRSTEGKRALVALRSSKRFPVGSEKAGAPRLRP